MTGSKLLAIYISVAAAQVTVPAATPDMHWSSIDIGLGIPFNVVIWIIAGATGGVWARRRQNKGNLTGVFLTSFFMTLAVVVFAPELLDRQWQSPGVQASAGASLAFTSQTWGPELVKWALSWITQRRSPHAD